jgi:4-hydroxybenzoate polyprenyltransferase
LFGIETKTALMILYTGAVALITLATMLSGGGIVALAGVLVFGLHLVWQVRTLDVNDSARCLMLFRSNRDAGLLLFAGLALDAAAGHFF